MKKNRRQKDRDPRVGDNVSVRYLTGPRVKGKIVRTFKISAAEARDAKKYYPFLKAGDTAYVVDGGGGDPRNFLRGDLKRIFPKIKKTSLGCAWEVIEKELKDGLPHDMPVPKPLKFKPEL